MKKLLSLLVALVLLTFSAPAQTTAGSQPLAFPGAEGFGCHTTGGRGGKVLHVTRLADDTSTGSFRWACNQSGTRTIVFDVSGTIYLNSELKLSRGNVTIAGQSAPGDGICIADYPFVIAADNVIIRYLRFRVGNRHVDKHEGDGLGGMDKSNIIIDHCSVSWSVDECLSVYGCKNLTVQWCIADQSMVNSGHSKGAHGYGGNWGGSGASYHHNLLAHHTSRTPRLGPRPSTQCDERMDLRNNVFYNWAGNGCYGGEGMNVNIVNNYYKPGPATDTRSTKIRQRIACINIRTSDYTKHDTPTPNDWDKMWHVWGHLFVEGNVNPDYADVTADNWTYGIYNQIDASGNDGTYTAVTKDTIRLTDPIPHPYTTTHAAEVAYERVVDYAGASLHRDSHDAQIAYDTRNRKASYTGQGLAAGMVNSQDDNRPADAPADWCAWPTLTSSAEQLAAITDTDQDGIPDSYELEWGLDPNNVNDGKLEWQDGYTHLERYLNSLVATITEAQNAGAEVQAIRQVRSTDCDSFSPSCYNLMGQAVSSPQRGLVISAGRKRLLLP